MVLNHDTPVRIRLAALKICKQIFSVNTAYRIDILSAYC